MFIRIIIVMVALIPLLDLSANEYRKPLPRIELQEIFSQFSTEMVSRGYKPFMCLETIDFELRYQGLHPDTWLIYLNIAIRQIYEHDEYVYDFALRGDGNVSGKMSSNSKDYANGASLSEMNDSQNETACRPIDEFSNPIVAKGTDELVEEAKEVVAEIKRQVQWEQRIFNILFICFFIFCGFIIGMIAGIKVGVKIRNSKGKEMKDV